MNDLDLTKACAEALGFYWAAKHDEYPYIGMRKYDPIHDDAQAMALVKHCRLDVTMVEKVDGRDAGWWRVDAPRPHNITIRHADLNRAIVRCVAEMREAKP